MNKPECLIIHHSGGTDANPLADTSHHTAAMIKNWHKAKGWADIGYHWVIEKTGKIVKGRDEMSTGAHCIGWNEKSIGICLCGNFDATLPTKEQEASLRIVLKDILKRYPKIPKDAIYPHRKFANKTCYGKKLSDTWAADLIKEPKENTINKEEIVSIMVPRSKVEIINNFISSLK